MTRYEEGRHLLKRFDETSGRRAHTRSGIDTVLEYEAAKMALARYLKRQAEKGRANKAKGFTPEA